MQIALDINTDVENFWWPNCGGNAFLNAACLGMFQLQCWREKQEADVATWPGADFFLALVLNHTVLLHLWSGFWRECQPKLIVAHFVPSFELGQRLAVPGSEPAWGAAPSWTGSQFSLSVLTLLLVQAG